MTTSKMPEQREFPDYCGNPHLAAQMAYELRMYHQRRGRKIEVEVLRTKRNGLDLYSIRSNIKIMNPPIGPIDKPDSY